MSHVLVSIDRKNFTHNAYGPFATESEADTAWEAYGGENVADHFVAELHPAPSDPERAVQERRTREDEDRTTDALVAGCYRCHNPAYTVANNHPVCDLHEKEEPI